MIDWLWFISGVLWVIALSLSLAALSFASWQAAIARCKLRDCLQKPIYQLVFSAAGLLFCSGLALARISVVQTIVWGLLAILFFSQAGLILYSEIFRKNAA